MIARSVTVKVRHLSIALLVIFTGAVVACYSIVVHNREITDDFILSQTFRHDPGRAIASLALSMTGLICYLICLATVLHKPIVNDFLSERRLKWAHRLACFCPIGVAAITIDFNVALHTFFATCVFVPTAISLTLLLIKDHFSSEKSRIPLLKTRLCLTIIGLISLIIFGSAWKWSPNSLIK